MDFVSSSWLQPQFCDQRSQSWWTPPSKVNGIVGTFIFNMSDPPSQIELLARVGGASTLHWSRARCSFSLDSRSLNCDWCRIRSCSKCWYCDILYICWYTDVAIWNICLNFKCSYEDTFIIQNRLVLRYILACKLWYSSYHEVAGNIAGHVHTWHVVKPSSLQELYLHLWPVWRDSVPWCQMESSTPSTLLPCTSWRAFHSFLVPYSS